MGSGHFFITEEQRKEYASGYLLDLIQNGSSFHVVLEGADRDLEPLFVFMMSKDYLDLDENQNYCITHKGLEKLDNLKKRYEEYLAHFDIYCAVDTEQGEFAFEKIFELDDAEWDAYLSQERFLDLRIAVAWFKKINPADFVFLSYLKEGRFDTEKEGWQFDLLSGLVWQEIEEIIDTAIQIEDLAYVDDQGQEVTGEMVIADIIAEGAKLNGRLHAEEDKMNLEENQYPNDYYCDKQEPHIVTTYERYYDPFFISPIWFIF